MLSNKSLGIAGAAMLGSVALLGTNAANAAINLDSSDKSKPAVTYAQETVNETVPSDDGTFYMVSSAGDDSDLLDVNGAMGVSAVQGESLTITYTLSGGVFGQDLTAAGTELAIHASDSDRTGNQVTGNEVAKDSGGMKGDNMVVYLVSLDQGTSLLSTHVVSLRVPSLGVSMEGASVSVDIHNRDQDRETMKEYPMAVMLDRGIKETANAMNLTTYVERAYVDFGLSDDETPAPMLTGTVGSFLVNAASDVYNAQDGADATLAAMLHDDFDDADNDDAAQAAMVQFTGPTAVASRVWMSDMTCTTPAASDENDLIERESGSNNGKLKGVPVKDLDDPDSIMYLCMTVPGDKPIAAGSFNGKSSYTGIAGGMVKPVGMDTALGSIRRDGINVWLPYLTTNPKYSQRIIMVNNSDMPAKYMMEFVSDEDVMVTAGAGAMGTLAANKTTTLHLTNDDVMSVEGAPRAAALLVIEAQPGDITVSTNLTNKMYGTTDTVVYTAEEEM